MQTRAQELPENSFQAQLADLQRQIDQLRTPQSIGVGGSGNGNGVIQVLDSGGNVKVNIDSLGAAFIGTSGNVGINIYRNNTDYLAGQASGALYGLTQGSTKNFYIIGQDNIALSFGLGLSFLNSIASTKPAEIGTVFRLYTAALPTGTADPTSDLADGRFYFNETTKKLMIYDSNVGLWRTSGVFT